MYCETLVLSLFPYLDGAAFQWYNAMLGSFCSQHVLVWMYNSNARYILLSFLYLETRNHRVIKKLIKTLKDDDRMVREAACLSLGHLKSTEAIPHVVNVWYVYQNGGICV